MAPPVEQGCCKPGHDYLSGTPDWRTVLGLSANAVLEDIKKKKLAEILADPDRCAKYKKKSLEQAAKKAAKRAAEIAEACQLAEEKVARTEKARREELQAEVEIYRECAEEEAKAEEIDKPRDDTKPRKKAGRKKAAEVNSNQLLGVGSVKESLNNIINFMSATKELSCYPDEVLSLRATLDKLIPSIRDEDLSKEEIGTSLKRIECFFTSTGVVPSFHQGILRTIRAAIDNLLSPETVQPATEGTALASVDSATPKG